MPTILVVDDEPVIRKLLALVLDEEGFQVLSAKDGPDAVRLWQSHSGEIDLLVSDVTMPGMDGPSLARKLLAADPNLPVLFISGYQDEVPSPENMRFPVLSKPFSLACLLRMVCEAVRGRSAIAAQAGCKGG